MAPQHGCRQPLCFGLHLKLARCIPKIESKFVWERVQEGQIAFEYCNTQGMVVDSLTKVAGTETFTFPGAELRLVENGNFDRVGVL
jgi:hypothetical protein